LFEIGDIIKRNPNREPTDPPYDIFKNGNDIFLVIDIVFHNKKKLYCIRSLGNGDVLYSTLYNRNKLWSKLS